MPSPPESVGVRASFHTQRKIERISQAAVSVLVRDGHVGFESVRSLLLLWLREKAGHDLPPAMLAGGAGAHDLIDAQRTETVALLNPPYWAARQDDQDRKLPRRTWVTEASLAQSSPNVLRLGYRLHCVTAGELAAFSRSVPKFMRIVAQDHTIHLDGAEIDLDAALVETDEDVDTLVRLLRNPQRSVPVVAASVPGNSLHGAIPLINVDKLANDVFGTAHVRLLSWSAAFELSNRLGNRLSCYGGAVRIWRADRPLDESAAFDHPLFLGSRIADDGADRAYRSIVDEVLRISAGRRDAERLVPSFAEVRRAASEEARGAAIRAARSDHELLRLYELDNRRLTEEIKEVRAFHEEYVGEADREIGSLQVNFDEARREIAALNARLTTFSAAMRERMTMPDVPIPGDFEDIEAWAALYLGDEVKLLPRAIRLARKSLFENPPAAYQALLLLKETYVPMRRSETETPRSRWEAGLQQLGLECTPTFAGARAGQFGDEYFVEWRGRRRSLDLHLKGSNSRDPRYGFRLYFFWCDDEQRAVVGAFPSHLTNDAT